MLFGTEAKEAFNNVHILPNGFIKSGIYEYMASDKKVKFKVFYKDDYKFIQKDFTCLETGLKWLQLIRLE